ncbi:MAG: DUF2214 family protein [Gemmatimonas sp.]
MTAQAIAAFLHLISAVTAFACLAAELVLYREALPVPLARRLRRIDAGYGIALGAVVVTGSLRFLFFGAGAHAYLLNAVFWVKMIALLFVIMLSLRMTSHFMRSAVATDGVAAKGPLSYRRARTTLWAEAGLLAIAMLSAALMARGVGLQV